MESESENEAFEDALDAEFLPQAESSPEQPEFSRQEEREALYETLDQKVETILRLEDTLKGLRSSEDVPDAIADARADIHGRLTPDIEDGVTRLHKLSATVDRWTGEEEQEFISLRFNDEVQFIFEVDEMLTDLERKSDLLRSLNSTEKLVAYAAQKMDERIDSADVAQVRRTPLDVVMEIRPDLYGRLQPDYEVAGIPVTSNGFHHPGLPITFVRDNLNSQVTNSTIRHERMHNFLEGSRTMLDRTGQHSQESLGRMLTWIGESTKGGNPKVTTAFVRKMKTGRPILDDLQNEFLAELGNREVQGLGTVLMEKPNQQPTERFFNHVLNHATAGTQAFRALDRVLNFGDASSDPLVRLQARDFAKNIEGGFNRMMDEANRTLFIGKGIDGENPKADADRRVHALLHILPPTKYRHIERYLRHRYGTEAVDRVVNRRSPIPVIPNGIPE